MSNIVIITNRNIPKAEKMSSARVFLSEFSSLQNEIHNYIIQEEGFMWH